MSKGIMIHTAEINNEDKNIAIEELKRFIKSFDGDYSGENGTETVSKEAVEKGFESDLDYAVYLHGDKKIFYMVKGVMLDLKTTDFERYSTVANYEVKVSLDSFKILVTYAYVVG